jgi:hypothetical protein
VFESDTALHVPAGSKIMFQMHYTPNGTKQTDRSYVGIQFADPEEVKYQASGGAAMTPNFKIPAGADNHEVRSQYEFERDQLLLSMLPHMHLRGKAFRYTAHYPDGKEEILRYDFNWQLRYMLAEPKLMPKGTQIKCVAYFDNSEDNMTNPDPSIDVTWGDQTWEEMMIGFFTTREVDEVDPEKLTKEAEERAKRGAQMEAQAKTFISAMDKNGNGTLSKDEVPAQMKQFFDRIDSDKNGEVDPSEAAVIVGRMSGDRRGRRGGPRGRRRPSND